MLNIGGGELLLILLLALIVLGPDKLPDAAKQAGKVMKEFRKISNGFQRELRNAMKDPVSAATQERGFPDVTPFAAVLPPDAVDTENDDSDGENENQDSGAVTENSDDGPADTDAGVDASDSADTAPDEPPDDPEAGIPSDR